jgi:hypothetical protein
MGCYCSYHKISCIIIRGLYFCPSAVRSTAEYLQIPTNNMIIGTPASDFPFPLAKLNGVRMAVPRSDPAIRKNICARLRSVLEGSSAPSRQSSDCQNGESGALQHLNGNNDLKLSGGGFVTHLPSVCEEADIAEELKDSVLECTNHVNERPGRSKA